MGIMCLIQVSDGYETYILTGNIPTITALSAEYIFTTFITLSGSQLPGFISAYSEHFTGLPSIYVPNGAISAITHSI